MLVWVSPSAYRYGVLRDQGYPLEEVNLAREHLLMGLEVLHQAATVPGVRVSSRAHSIRSEATRRPRSLTKRVSPSPRLKTTAPGGPITRAYPDLIWEDSCSRDYLLGWVTAMGAAWEVMAEDPSFDEAIKAQLQGHAKDLGHALMEVRNDPAFCEGLMAARWGSAMTFRSQTPMGEGPFTAACMSTIWTAMAS